MAQLQGYSDEKSQRTRLQLFMLITFFYILAIHFLQIKKIQQLNSLCDVFVYNSSTLIFLLFFVR